MPNQDVRMDKERLQAGGAFVTPQLDMVLPAPLLRFTPDDTLRASRSIRPSSVARPSVLRPGRFATEVPWLAPWGLVA